MINERIYFNFKEFSFNNTLINIVKIKFNKGISSAYASENCLKRQSLLFFNISICEYSISNVHIMPSGPYLGVISIQELFKPLTLPG